MTDDGSATIGSRLRVPADRTKNASLPASEMKVDKFPRTFRREERIASVLARRQPSLTVVLEDVHDPHNVSAVLRSCDAVGVLDVHLVYVHDTPPRKSFNRATSGSAAKWIRLLFHDSIDACYETLRAQGFRILATALRDDTEMLYAMDLAKPTAFAFGNEFRGLTENAVDLADGTVGIPMQGMVESLNISVACAVSLYESMRQRLAAGMYETSQLLDTDFESLRSEWIAK